MAPIGSTPANPASFMARNFSRTDPFTPMVEYMIALRRSRGGAAQPAGTSTAAAAPVVSWRKVRRFMVGSLRSNMWASWEFFRTSNRYFTHHQIRILTPDS